MIGLNFRDMLPQVVVDELDQLVAGIRSYFFTEHKEDGTHGAVTADSLTATGQILSQPETVDALATARVGARVGNNAAVLLADANSAAVVFVDGNDNPNLSTALGGEANGPDTFAQADGYPSLGSTADVQKIGLVAYSDLVPLADDTYYLGWGSASGDYLRRWKSLYFSKVVYGPKVVATTAFYERSRSAAVGEWTAVAHSAGNFTASSGSWTVDSADQITLAYTLIGKTMIVAFTIASTDVSAAATQLRIAIPGGFTAAKRMDTQCTIRDAGGTPVQGQCFVAAAGTTINIEKNGGAAFTITAGDNTNVTGTITFEVA